MFTELCEASIRRRIFSFLTTEILKSLVLHQKRNWLSKEIMPKLIRLQAHFKPTLGNDEQDANLAKQLTEDAKENSEHVMLVDLARNDLRPKLQWSKSQKYKEVQFFSHVIHLVSKVTGKLKRKP